MRGPSPPSAQRAATGVRYRRPLQNQHATAGAGVPGARAPPAGLSAARASQVEAVECGRRHFAARPPPPRTKWTRRVPSPRTNRTRRVPHPRTNWTRRVPGAAARHECCSEHGDGRRAGRRDGRAARALRGRGTGRGGRRGGRGRRPLRGAALHGSAAPVGHAVGGRVGGGGGFRLP